MDIQDNRITNSEWFKTLDIGTTFEYLDSIYIKTGVSSSEPNAVDLKTGSEDIIRFDADVTPVHATLVVDNVESEAF